MTDRVLVRFDGDGSGVEELTWGQREVWRSIRSRESSVIVGGVVALPAGSTVDDMASTLRYAMSRHQSLRTRLRFDADGRPHQDLAASGETALDVVEGGQDPAAVADQVRERYQLTDFDYERDWPMRMAVVVRDGRPTHLVVAYSHLAIDAHGIEALAADLTGINGRSTANGRPVTAVQPLELARQQRTPAALRQSRASVRYWERLLRALPPQQQSPSPDPRTPRYWQLAYNSPAAYRAVLAVAARTGAHPGPVRLAAFAVALARVTQDRMVVLQTLVHNRFRPGFTGSVSMLTQPGICVVDVGNSTFDEVVGRAWQATARAGKHAYYDPEELDEMLATVARDRGDDLDISCFYNDRGKHVPRPSPDHAPNRADVLTALPRSTMRWAHRFDGYDRSVVIHIYDAPDALDCLICVDTHRISPAQLVALARNIEAVLVAAALDPAAPTGVPAHSGNMPGTDQPVTWPATHG